MSPAALEAALRAIGAARYHNNHPFHKLMYGGELTRGQIQAWALHRYYHQTRVPAHDAYLLAVLPASALLPQSRKRLVDHDGDQEGSGGSERWLKLAEGVGLDLDYVASTAGLLPATRFAVDAYVEFVRD